MKYYKLHGREASRVVMGCMRIGDKPLAQVEELIREAIRGGVNMFDHADIYGNGNSEKVFGVAVRDIGLSRSDYILQTKCGIRRNGGDRWFDFSREHILSSVEGSLKRLNTEYIDLLLLHRPDTLMEPQEIAEAFEKLKADGKVRAFGVSNFAAYQIQALESYGVRVAANQVQFSLAHTPMVNAGFNVNMQNEEAVNRAGGTLEYCRMKKIAMQAWLPLQYGLIKGTFLDNEAFAPLNEALNAMAEEKGCTAATLALAWILRHPAFAQVVTGTTSPDRLRAICAASEIDLTREEWYDLYAATGKMLP